VGGSLAMGEGSAIAKSYRFS